MFEKTADNGFARASSPVPPKDPEALSTDDVRQGETGHGVRYMLVFSLGAALIALAVVWVFVV